MDKSLFFLKNSLPDSKAQYQLFVSTDLKQWLLGLINFWNQHGAFEDVVRGWNIKQLQHAVDFFSAPECVQLINMIFFYKLHPEQLFEEALHPEKLISLRIKLDFVHHKLELIQQQLVCLAATNSIVPPVDYLLHNDTLPHGIQLAVNEHNKVLIQEAVKQLRAAQNRSESKLNDMKLLHDLLAAYKFWFNPNRLIDTVMLLKQRLKESFTQKLSSLCQQLTTTECLELYGYFANKDTKSLLQALELAISSPQNLKWLPKSTSQEMLCIIEVLSTLRTVMEAVRVELNNRAIMSSPYCADKEQKPTEIGTRNRDAVLRILEVYSDHQEPINLNLEQLFRELELLQSQSVDDAIS